MALGWGANAHASEDSALVSEDSAPAASEDSAQASEDSARAASEDSAAAASGSGLRILLTSDDGVNGQGLLVLRGVLCGAGHRVTVVAPSADRSGSSGALNLNVTLRATRTQFSCGGAPSETWALTGSPADAVLFGLSSVFKGAPPDLVISGMNYGQNVGRAVNHSGTVGAAVVAAEEGVPSIAVSIAINPQDAGTGFSQTFAAAPHVAASVTALVEQLRATAGHGEGLLPDRVALNLNYPVVLDEAGKFDPARVQGPRVTRVGHGEVVRVQYLRIPNAVDLVFSSAPLCGVSILCGPERVKDADTTALDEGAISITPLAVDWSVRPELDARIHARLRR
jgi:5'/3'-nucleotidase SurE